MRCGKCVQQLHHEHNFSTSQEPDSNSQGGGQHPQGGKINTALLLLESWFPVKWSWFVKNQFTDDTRAVRALLFDWAVWTRRQLVFITFGSCEQTARSSVADRHFKAASVRKCVILCLWHDCLCDCFPLIWQSWLNLDALVVLSARTGTGVIAGLVNGCHLALALRAAAIVCLFVFAECNMAQNQKHTLSGRVVKASSLLNSVTWLIFISLDCYSDSCSDTEKKTIESQRNSNVAPGYVDAWENNYVASV